MHANQFLDLPKIPNLRVLSCWLFLRNFKPLSSTQVGQRQELSFFKIFCFSWFIKEAKPNVNCYSLYICLDPEVRRQSLTKVRLAYSKESIIGIFWSLLQNFASVWLSFSKTFIWPIIYCLGFPQCTVKSSLNILIHPLEISLAYDKIVLKIPLLTWTNDHTGVSRLFYVVQS